MKSTRKQASEMRELVERRIANRLSEYEKTQLESNSDPVEQSSQVRFPWWAPFLVLLALAGLIFGLGTWHNVHRQRLISHEDEQIPQVIQAWARSVNTGDYDLFSQTICPQNEALDPYHDAFHFKSEVENQKKRYGVLTVKAVEVKQTTADKAIAVIRWTVAVDIHKIYNQEITLLPVEGHWKNCSLRVSDVFINK